MSGPLRRVFGFATFKLDVEDRLLTREGQPLRLNPKEFETLRVLVENAGRLVSKEKFITEVWPDSFVTDSSLTRNISILRRALGDEFIETVPRVGYRFTAEVKEMAPLEGGSGQEGQAYSGESPSNRASLETMQSPIQVRTGIRPGLSVRQPRVTAFRLAIFALALLACTAVWLYFVRFASPPTLPPPRIAPLTALAGQENDIVFSPRGDRVAFAWNGGAGKSSHIYVKLIAAGSPLRLTAGTGSESSPTWSPDGQQIAFLRESKGGNGEVLLVPSLGGPERKLGEVSVRAEYNYTDKNLDWSPDGKSLAVVTRTLPHAPYRISLMSVETGEQRYLTSPPPNFIGDSNPAWSPDGKQLAFIRMANTIVSDIYLQPVAGGSPRRLTSDDRLIGGLCWNANGREVIYSSNRGGLFTLWKTSTSRPEPRPLAAVGPDTYAPAVSRDGRHLAYTHWFANTAIWQVDVSGSTPRGSSPVKLIASGRAQDSPQFSPDGKQIVFASDRSGSSEIWVCEADGSHAVQLTFFGGPATGTPRWSPDGHEIAFDSRPRGRSGIYIIGAQGGTPTLLSSGDWDDVMPSWSRDGNWIYCASNRGAGWQVWKTPRGGGQPVQVTKQGGFESFELSDGRYLYFSKHGAPGIWRMSLERGDETLVFDRKVGRHWCLTASGIFFIDSSSSPRPLIEFMPFGSKGISTVAALEHDLGTTPGLAVSPDRRWILYAQADRVESDILLVENFR